MTVMSENPWREGTSTGRPCPSRSPPPGCPVIIISRKLPQIRAHRAVLYPPVEVDDLRAIFVHDLPKPDGTITQEDKAVLLKIGAWLKTNGEAIYGSTKPLLICSPSWSLLHWGFSPQPRTSTSRMIPWKFACLEASWIPRERMQYSPSPLHFMAMAQKCFHVKRGMGL